MLRALFFISLGIVLSCQPVQAEELINWHEDLAAARQISQQYKVPLLIHFYGDQCMPCKTLEQNVFTRPEVASVMQRYFVPVRINATRDRRTAAEYGVHSWPQDVFVAPDGKTLMQGVCNQNPANYLQNLQNIALMNRDRNAMLAGGQSNPTTTPAPYGRTAASSLQQAAPGRDAAPSPYSNPSSGALPYGAPTTLASAPSNSQTALPSPTMQGQSAFGQASSGQVAAGPIPDATGMTLPPPQSPTVNENKLPNVPGGAYWQNGAGAFSNSQAPTAGTSSLPLAPPAPPAAAQPKVAGNPNGYTNGRPVAGRQAIVANPHFANPTTSPALEMTAQNTPVQAAPAGNAQPPQGAAQSYPPQSYPPQSYPPQWTPAGQTPRSAAPSAQLPGQLVSSSSSVIRDQQLDFQRTGLPGDPQSLSSSSAPSLNASVPALSGYCPVALNSEPSQWIKGSDRLAIRHRGRIYFLADEAAAQKFLATPDSFTPVLSGYDPLLFLKEGRLVEGSIYDGVLKDRQYLLLFSSEANKQAFYENYDRYINELEAVVRQQVSRH